MKKLITIITATLLLYLINNPGMAIENLGVYGQVYEILEPDMMDVIKNERPVITRERVMSKIKKSLSVSYDIPYAKKEKIKIINFSYTVPHDIVINGNLVAKKGDVLNPLEKMTLNEKYLFIRGDQVDNFNELLKDRTVKPVITKGNLDEIIKKYPDIRFYMASRSLLELFQVKEIPAIVYQPKGEKYIIVKTIPIMEER